MRQCEALKCILCQFVAPVTYIQQNDGMTFYDLLPANKPNSTVTG